MEKQLLRKNAKKIPLKNHTESDCHHYYIECKKYGYINEKGEIIELGDYTFEEIQKK